MGYVIYGDLGSGAFSTEAALAEAGVDYAFHPVSLKANAQREPAFLKVNPSGKMPALQLPDGGIVTESAALLIAIADWHPQANLLPPERSFARADALRWIVYMASELYPMVEIVDYPERFAPAGAQSAALRENARAHLRTRMLTLENAVAGPFLLAQGFCVADIYAAMFSRWDVGAEWRAAHLPKLEVLADAVAQRPRIAPVWAKHFVR